MIILEYLFYTLIIVAVIAMFGVMFFEAYDSIFKDKND